MNNEMVMHIMLISSLTWLPIFILALFYKKINIRDVYKKILILWLILLNILGISIIIILENLNSIQNNISQWNYEIFFLLIPIIGLLGFIVFYIIRLSLWKIDIKIYGNKFTSWDKLTWDIDIKLKKDIRNSNLYVYLRWYQYVRTGSGSNSWWSRKKKYEDKIILEKDTFFESNYIKNYNFSFDIPYNNEEWKNAISLLEKEYDKEDLTDEQKEKAIQMANSFLKFAWVDSWKEYLKLWKVEVRLEKGWIDLFNQKIVDVVRKLKD